MLGLGDAVVGLDELAQVFAAAGTTPGSIRQLRGVVVFLHRGMHTRASGVATTHGYQGWNVTSCSSRMPWNARRIS